MLLTNTDLGTNQRTKLRHGLMDNSDRIQTEIHVQSLHTKDRTLKVSDRNMRRAKNPHPK